MTAAIRLDIESTPLASQLRESRDPEALERDADEAEASANWGDEVADDHLRHGRLREYRQETVKNAKSRARARYLRTLAGVMREKAK